LKTATHLKTAAANRLGEKLKPLIKAIEDKFNEKAKLFNEIQERKLREVEAIVAPINKEVQQRLEPLYEELNNFEERVVEHLSNIKANVLPRVEDVDTKIKHILGFVSTTRKTLIDTVKAVGSPTQPNLKQLKTNLIAQLNVELSNQGIQNLDITTKASSVLAEMLTTIDAESTTNK
jgi:hypothetical protein